LQFNVSSINGITLNIVDELEYYTVFDTIQFTYNVDVGYEELENFALTTNSGVLSNNNGIYSLSGFTNDIEIGAEGLGVIGCRLIYDSDLFTINITNPKEKYYIGDEIVFTIMPNVEYSSFEVYINGGKLWEINGSFNYEFSTTNVYEYTVTIVIN